MTHRYRYVYKQIQPTKIPNLIFIYEKIVLYSSTNGKIDYLRSPGCIY